METNERAPLTGAKAEAQQLAELLAATDGGRVLKLMNRLQFFGASEIPTMPTPSSEQSPTIGVWEMRDAGGTRFVRTDRLRVEWSSWADVEEIAPSAPLRNLSPLRCPKNKKKNPRKETATVSSIMSQRDAA
jgi:hypothetical protein